MEKVSVFVKAAKRMTPAIKSLIRTILRTDKLLIRRARMFLLMKRAKEMKLLRKKSNGMSTTMSARTVESIWLTLWCLNPT